MRLTGSAVHMKHYPNNKKRICRIGMLMAVVFCVAGIISIQGGPAFASEKAALDVYMDDTCLHSFTMQELEGIAKKEGSKKYTFSGFNTYPTAQQFDAVEGPSVAGILNAALQGSGGSTVQIADDQIIRFRAGDGVTEQFRKGTLLEQRWYYPNFKLEQGREGKKVLPESMADPTAVPAVISLREDGHAYGEHGRYEVGRLMFGQKASNEQNHSMFVKYMATSDKDDPAKRGRITICSTSTAPPEALNPIRTAEADADGITFDRSVNYSHTEQGSRYWIYFTTDGTEPDVCSDMYNYNNYSFGKPEEKFNKPALPKAGQPPIRVKVMSYDKTDSEVSEFAFPGKPVIKSLSSKGKIVTVKWKKAADAIGYQIWRSTKKTGSYKLVKTIKKGSATSWKDKGLKKGKTYYYKVRAYGSTSGNTGYGSYSAVKHIKVK